MWFKKTEKPVWMPENGRMTSKQKIAYVQKETGADTDFVLAALRWQGWHIASAVKMIKDYPEIPKFPNF